MYILPKPQSITSHNGHFTLKNGLRILLCGSICEQEYHYASILLEAVKEKLGVQLEVAASIPQNQPSIRFKKSTVTRAGEYSLVIAENGIVIASSDGEGLLYGIQTLRQIMMQSGAVLPCMEIADYPIIPNRGFFHDVTRGQVSTLEMLKRLADKMSFYKLNQLQLYIEHSFRLDGFSEMWRDDDPLTPQEILELDRYCKDIHIELIPSIASFGHFYKALRTKTYEALCELENPRETPFSFIDRMHHHTLDVSNPDAFAMVEKMISQFAPLFSSQKFNIGADETFDLGKGKNARRAEEEGVGSLYVDFLCKLVECVRAAGKEPMFWGDIILKHPEYIEKLPQDITCLNWDYSDHVPEQNVRLISESGIAQYCCPGVSSWNQFINTFEYAYQNIEQMCRYAKKYGAVGILNTNWGDYANVNLPETSIPGLICGAALSWGDTMHFDELCKAIGEIEYGDRTGTIMELLCRLSHCQIYEWGHVVKFMEQDYTTVKKTKTEVQGYFDSLNSDALVETDRLLDTLETELYGKLKELAPEKRIAFATYFVMCQAIRLFNRTAHLIKNGETVFSAWQTACELEEWLQDYKRMWRGVAKESELYRVSNIIFWYADYLRQGNFKR
ncbi:MAG: family 20 glycosylhydrolase [Angelakisella sp.]